MKHVHFLITIVLSLYLVLLSTSQAFAWESDISGDLSSENLSALNQVNLANVTLTSVKHNWSSPVPFNLRLATRRGLSNISYNNMRVHYLASADLEAHFDQYAANFNLDPQVLKTIAYCESHYNPAAISKSGTYAGLYQFSASTWQSTRNAMGLDPNPDLRFDAGEAIMTAAFKIHAGGIGAWPVCGQI